jgi:hypothetical protein
VDLAADVEGDDVRTLLRQPDRVRAALPPGTTADEGDLAFENSHVQCSCLVEPFTGSGPVE